MCGIAGIYGLALDKPERELFENILGLNVFRGRDSTGVVRVVGRNQDKAVRTRTIRTLQDAWGFLGTKQGQDFIFTDTVENGLGALDSKPVSFLGHCRAATKGVVKKENSHPFSFENVIGVHNGTVRGNFRYAKDFETDSEAIYKNINDHGIEATLEELASYDSAYALVWIDRQARTMNFVRNSKRPLSFAYVYGRSALAWSSDKTHLALAVRHSTVVNMSNFDNTITGLTDNAIFTLKPNHLMPIPIGKPATFAEITDLGIPESFTSGSANSGGTTTTSRKGTFVQCSDGVYRPQAEADEFEKNRSKAFEAANKVINLPDRRQNKEGGSKDYGNFQKAHGKELADLPWLNTPLTKKESSENLGLGGVPLSRAELKFKLSCGCVHCGTKSITVDQVESGEKKVHWWSRDYFACDDCFQNSPGDWIKYAMAEDWGQVANQ